MKITRLFALSMLILTLTLVIASCDTTTPTETSVARGGTYQFNQLEDRIEPNRRAPSEQGTEAESFPVTESATQASDRKGDVALTAEEAEAIALAHAEVAAADVLHLRTEPDREDGHPVYEVEFYVAHPDGQGCLEYEYTVHADSGKILEFETEWEKGR